MGIEMKNHGNLIGLLRVLVVALVELNTSIVYIDCICYVQFKIWFSLLIFLNNFGTTKTAEHTWGLNR